MKKILIILAIITIIVIFPNKGVSSDTSSFNVKNNNNWTTYKENIITYEEEKIVCRDISEEILFETEVKMKNYNIQGNEYIDIIDYDNNRVISIDETGEVINQEDVSRETYIYKSIDEYNFVTVYYQDDVQYIKISDVDGNIIRKIEHENSIVNVVYDDTGIYTMDFQMDDKLSTNISKYDKNGNLKMTKTISGGHLYSSIDKEGMNIITDEVMITLNKNLEVISEEKVEPKFLEATNVLSNNDEIVFLVDNRLYDTKGRVVTKLENNVYDIKSLNQQEVIIEQDNTLTMKHIN